jgi:hypothetical protein
MRLLAAGGNKRADEWGVDSISVYEQFFPGRSGAVPDPRQQRRPSARLERGLEMGELRQVAGLAKHVV